MKMASGVSKFKCATLAEAEMLARCSARDVLIAYPMIGPAVNRLVELIQAYPETKFITIVDNEGPARDLSAAMVASGRQIEVMIDLDVGMHRTGIAPGAEAVKLYRLIVSLPGLAPGGLHGYDGHLNQADYSEREPAAAAARLQALNLRDELIGIDLPVPRVVMAGTPTFPCHAAVHDIELSPGTIFFMDWTLRDQNRDLHFEPAALLLSQIVSKPTPELVSLDAGSKSIATDSVGDRGRLMNIDYKGFYRHSEEHWTIQVPDSGQLRIGQEVYIMPSHICPTFAWQQEVYAVDGQGMVFDTWPVTARNRRLSI
jgi:D-serine deaminase-like pyridoxal phosphate-dependent protein